jgi:hypothetical protein
VAGVGEVQVADGTLTVTDGLNAVDNRLCYLEFARKSERPISDASDFGSGPDC